MKIIRYEDPSGAFRYGCEQSDGKIFELGGDLFGSLQPTEKTAEIKRRLAPVAPSNLIGIGLNYRRHAEESGAKIPERPIVFIKLLNSLQNPGDPIELPSSSQEVDYECELAVVIGKSCRNVTSENSLQYVLGYTCANDVSARDWQLKWGGGQWCRGKSFDTFCPLGPVLVTPDEIPNPNDLKIQTILNSDIVQDWNTNDMIFDVPALISFLSQDTTLIPGTVILTGTPHGVGMAAKPPRYLRPGDTVSISVEKIGSLTNPVVAVG
jgi:2-keto-4-pentenoate hydratase/2-oxohepta-3-ene-1,7-dioic acid hydratase in catechol pathway